MSARENISGSTGEYGECLKAKQKFNMELYNRCLKDLCKTIERQRTEWDDFQKESAKQRDSSKRNATPHDNLTEVDAQKKAQESVLFEILNIVKNLEKNFQCLCEQLRRRDVLREEIPATNKASSEDFWKHTEDVPPILIRRIEAEEAKKSKRPPVKTSMKSPSSIFFKTIPLKEEEDVRAKYREELVKEFMIKEAKKSSKPGLDSSFPQTELDASKRQEESGKESKTTSVYAKKSSKPASGGVSPQKEISIKQQEEPARESNAPSIGISAKTQIEAIEGVTTTKEAESIQQQDDQLFSDDEKSKDEDQKKSVKESIHGKLLSAKSSRMHSENRKAESGVERLISGKSSRMISREGSITEAKIEKIYFERKKTPNLQEEGLLPSDEPDEEQDKQSQKQEKRRSRQPSRISGAEAGIRSESVKNDASKQDTAASPESAPSPDVLEKEIRDSFIKTLNPNQPPDTPLKSDSDKEEMASYENPNSP